MENYSVSLNIYHVIGKFVFIWWKVWDSFWLQVSLFKVDAYDGKQKWRREEDLSKAEYRSLVESEKIRACLQWTFIAWRSEGASLSKYVYSMYICMNVCMFVTIRGYMWYVYLKHTQLYSQMVAGKWRRKRFIKILLKMTRHFSYGGTWLILNLNNKI